jgi:hypothetical protein
MKVRDATNDDYTQEKPTPHFFVAYSIERLSLLPLISNLSTRPEAKNNCVTSLKTCNFGGKRFHGWSPHTRKVNTSLLRRLLHRSLKTLRVLKASPAMGTSHAPIRCLASRPRQQIFLLNLISSILSIAMEHAFDL